MLSRLLLVAPSVVGSTTFSSQDWLSLQLVQLQASRTGAVKANIGEDLPGPYTVDVDIKFHMPEMLQEKVLNIAALVAASTRSDLGTEVLAAVSRNAETDHIKADKLRQKIKNNEKVEIADIVDVVSLLSRSQTAESADVNGVLLTSHEMSMIMNGFKPEEFGSNYTDGYTDVKLATFQGDQLRGPTPQPWRAGHVKYCFAEDVSARVKQAFKMATKHYMQAMPCLTFEDVGWRSGKSDSKPQFQNCHGSPALFITSDPRYGCFSHRGMMQPTGTMSSQQFQLHDPGCTFVGTVVHELGHALGLGHTPPANTTQVLHQKIQHGKNKNLEFDAVDEIGETNPSLSIMHYDSHAFAADPKQKTLDGPDAEKFGQRVGLGLYDIVSLSHMYRQTAAECVRSGLAGFGSVKHHTIQCWQRRGDCPGRDTGASRQSIWESMKHLIR